MKKIKSILVSQPQPADIAKTPYADIIKKYGVTIDFEKFIKVEGISASEVRQEKIKLPEYSAIILTSKNAIDHFFRIAKEMRYAVPESLKYFCVSESVSLYLQRYVQYRKRKIFFGKLTFTDLIEVMKKHKEENYLYVSSDVVNESHLEELEAAKLKYTKALMFRTVSSDLSKIDINKYDMIVMFSPAGIISLKENFPNFEQGEMIVGGFGPATCAAITEAGFTVNLSAPAPGVPSITTAIENYLEAEKKKLKK